MTLAIQNSSGLCSNWNFDRPILIQWTLFDEI